MPPIDTRFNERKIHEKSTNFSPRKSKRKSNSSKKNSSGDSLNLVTYRMEAGKNDGVMPKDIVGAIASEAGIDGKNIGRIMLYDDFSTVDLPEGMPNDIFQHLKHKVRVKQRPMKLSVLNKNDQFKEKKKQKKSFNAKKHT
jgi:ATP-dependent RNA helicase DeaD